MRRILLAITDLNIGGTPTVVRELASRLHSPPTVCVEVLCLTAPGPVAVQLQQRGVTVHSLHAHGNRDLALFPRFHRHIRSHRYDTVFSFLIHANLLGASAARFFPGVRFLQSIQTTQPKPAWHWMLQRLIWRYADRIVVPSESVAQCAFDRSGIPMEKLVVIPNAIEPAEFAELAKVDRSIPQSPMRIGFIGRLDPVKRIGDLIAAVSLLGEGFAFDIYGVGSERAALESLAAQLNVKQQVKFHGAVDCPQTALGKMDVLVLPSEAEGFGLVLIEAMAAGVPVVASDAPGIRNVIQHECNGLLAPVGMTDELANQIARLASDLSLRQSLVYVGKRTVAEQYCWHRILPVYQKLLGLNS